jgi:hypothetical protein
MRNLFHHTQVWFPTLLPWLLDTHLFHQLPEPVEALLVDAFSPVRISSGATSSSVLAIALPTLKRVSMSMAVPRQNVPFTFSSGFPPLLPCVPHTSTEHPFARDSASLSPPVAPQSALSALLLAPSIDKRFLL